MKRSGGIAALTVAAVLVAGGTAAALNTKVLDPTGPTPVGSADTIVPSGEPTPDDTSDGGSAGLGSPTGVSLTPAPEDEPSSAEPVTSPERTSAGSSSRASRPTSATSTRTRSARPTSSSERPEPSESESESGGGHGGSGSPSPSRSDD